MTKVFLHIFNLSITASWLIAAVLLVRWIIKGKTPRWVSCMLWAFVGLRLVIPFYFESDFSIIPSKETVIPEAVYGEVSEEIREPEVSVGEQIGGETEQIGGEVSVSPLPETSVGENITADGNQAEPEKIEVAPSKKEPTEYIHSGFQALDERVNEVINEAESEETAEEVGVVRRVTEAASVVWLCGVVLMLVYAAVNYLLLKKRVSVFVPEKGNIRRSENVGSPFILGFVRPKIYLPFGLTKETEEHIIAHELAHLNRRDHWIKPLGFALLSVYWFNPLVWVAYILLCRDIEYACDEKVVKEMGEDARKAYATALLECGVKRNMIAACPVAFGEIGVKDRVRSALSYKKPMLWIIIAAVVISAVTAGVFLLAPKDGEDASSVEESSGESDVSGGILDDPSPNNEVVLDFDSELGGDCIVGLYKSFPDDVPLYSEFGNNVYIAKYKDGKIGTQKIFDGKETDFFARASSIYEKDGNVYGMLSLGETFSNYQRYYCRFNKDGSVERLFECFNVLYKDEKVYFCERYSGLESGDLRFRICSADIDGSGKSILAEDIPVPVLYDNFLVCDDGVVYLSNDDKEINILRQDGTTENIVRLTDGSCQIRFINNGFVYYTQSERISGKDHFYDKDDIYRHSLIRIKLNGEDAEQLLTKDIVGYGLGFAPVTFGSKLLVFHESEVEVYEETLSDPVVYEYKEFSYDQIFQVCVTKDWLAVIGSDGNGSAKTVVYNTKGEVTFNSDNSEDETSNDENSNNSEVSDTDMESNWKLVVNGVDITQEYYAEKMSDGICLPFVAVMETLGAEFTWETDRKAEMKYLDLLFALDVDECSFISKANGVELFRVPGGGLFDSVPMDKELLLDFARVHSFFRRAGITIERNYDEKIIAINGDPNHIPDNSLTESVYFY